MFGESSSISSTFLIHTIDAYRCSTSSMKWLKLDPVSSFSIFLSFCTDASKSLSFKFRVQLSCSLANGDPKHCEPFENHGFMYWNSLRNYKLESGRAPLRTLLIDNYDSYTYNIFQQLSVMNGVEPHVCYNDECNSNFMALIEKIGFTPDNIVISPGPGNPKNVKDFGMCSQVLKEAANTPILGVCLGHQGLALAHGAQVVKAPIPMHGRISTVYHNKNTLFSGIEQGFKVVRYHSLVVEPRSVTRSNVLLPTAWSEDGSLMGLEHKFRPHWSIQFHPESIGTEKGNHIMKNFRELSISWMKKRNQISSERREIPQTKIFLPTQLNPCSDVPHEELEIWALKLKLVSSSENLFLHLYENYTGTKWWLDSSTRQKEETTEVQRTNPAKARFSFMGAADSEIIEYFGNGSCIIRDENGKRSVQGNLLKVLQDKLFSNQSSARIYGCEKESLNMSAKRNLKANIGSVEEFQIDWKEPNCAIDLLPFELWGGYIGYFGYEMRHETVGSKYYNRSRRDREDFEYCDASPGPGNKQDSIPVGFWMRCERFIAIDHDTESIFVVSLGKRETEAAAKMWAAETAIKILTLQDTGSSIDLQSFNSEGVICNFDRSKARYEEDLRKAMQLIELGETYEVCLTNQVECDLSSDKSAGTRVFSPLDIYLALRRKNPAPYAALVIHDPAQRFQQSEGLDSCEHDTASDPCFAICCSSPERFLRLDRHQIIESKPIKGTHPRGPTPELDEQFLRKLATSEKAMSENLMITDLVRNDMGRICEVGSVHVPVLMAVESYATVHQMITKVRGKLKGSLCSLDAVAAAFPPGSMTGAPKVRTMEIIHELEDGVPRGVYSGSLGFLSFGGQADLNVVIRTGVVEPGKLRIGTGGAVVAMSDIGEEYDEMLLKARSVLRAIGLDVDTIASDCERTDDSFEER